MKKIKMVQILFILLCLLGYKLTIAQSEYAVTAKGDTIPGNVKYLDFSHEKKIQVTGADKKKNVYNVLQVKAFKMNGEQYHTIHTEQGYLFMKVEKYGYLSLYSFQLPNQVTWNGSYIEKKDGSGLEVPTIGFKKKIKQFLADCPDVTSKIESGDLSKGKLNDIIDQYNACIDNKTKDLQQNVDQTNAWDKLEKEVNNLNDFADKSTVLEMINEVQSKITKGEKIPNFLIEGIKGSLKDQTSVQSTLEKALKEIPQ